MSLRAPSRRSWVRSWGADGEPPCVCSSRAQTSPARSWKNHSRSNQTTCQCQRQCTNQPRRILVRLSRLLWDSLKTATLKRDRDNTLVTTHSLLLSLILESTPRLVQARTAPVHLDAPPPTAGLLSTLSSPGVGTSSASAAAAALPWAPYRKKRFLALALLAYIHLIRTYIDQRPQRHYHDPTLLPAPQRSPPHHQSRTAHSMSASSSSRERRSMTPGPGRSSSHAVALGHARSVSVAPGASPSLIPPMPRAPHDRGATPAPSSSASAAAAALSTPTKHGHGHPNGSASAGGFSNGLLADLSGHGNGISISRPPVPPKPRTLSGNSGSPPKHTSNSHLHSRGILDDRGLESDRETILSTKNNAVIPNAREGKERRTLKHERWFPALLGRKAADSPMRPATSMN